MQIRTILIDKTFGVCYDSFVNKNHSQIRERLVPMKANTKHFRKRDAILTCLMNTDTHPSAEMVHQMLQETHPDISQATVYRNLALFKKQGQITSVATVNGTERFDANSPLPFRPSRAGFRRSSRKTRIRKHSSSRQLLIQSGSPA